MEDVFWKHIECGYLGSGERFRMETKFLCEYSYRRVVEVSSSVRFSKFILGTLKI